MTSRQQFLEIGKWLTLQGIHEYRGLWYNTYILWGFPKDTSKVVFTNWLCTSLVAVAGPKITLQFPHLFVYIFICASALISCTITTSCTSFHKWKPSLQLLMVCLDVLEQQTTWDSICRVFNFSVGTVQNLDSGLWTGPWTGLWTE